MPQDPVKKAKVPTAIPESQKELLRILMAENPIFGTAAYNEKFQTVQNATLAETLKNVRDQEKHTSNLQSNAIQDVSTQDKLETEALKRDQIAQKIAIDSAKAQANGLAVSTQDPVPQEPQIQAEVDPLTLAVNVAKNRLAEQGDKGAQLQDAYAQQHAHAMLDALQTAVDKASSEKTLRNSPLGPLGQITGGILNLGSNIATLGNYSLGTELLGGKMSETDKVELLSRAIYTMAPVYRSELDFALGNKRVETSADRYAQIGYSRSNAMFGNSDDPRSADAGIDIAFNIDRTLADKMPDDFGSEATSGVGDLFHLWDSSRIRLDAIENATDMRSVETLTKEYEQRIMPTFKNVLREYMRNGGDAATLKAQATKAQSFIDAEYNQSAAPQLGETKDAIAYRLQRKSMGVEASNKFNGFVDTAVAMMDKISEEKIQQAFGNDKVSIVKASDIEGTFHTKFLAGSGKPDPLFDEPKPFTAGMVARLKTILTRRGKAKDFNLMAQEITKALKGLRMDKTNRENLADILNRSVEGKFGEDAKKDIINRIILKQEYFGPELPAIKASGFGPK